MVKNDRLMFIYIRCRLSCCIARINVNTTFISFCVFRKRMQQGEKKVHSDITIGMNINIANFLKCIGLLQFFRAFLS